MPHGQGRGGEGCEGGCGRGHGGGARGGRASLLEPAVLVALTTATSHGYDLRAVLEDLTSGYLVADPGGLYRALRRMEDEGLMVSTWTEGGHGPQRRTYRITDDGRDALGLWSKRLSAQRLALDGILRAIDHLGGPDRESTKPADPANSTTQQERDDATR